MLIYQKKYEKSDESNNLQSSLLLRDSLAGVGLLPLPFFHIEAIKLTGSKPSQLLRDILCQHMRLKPEYNDLVPKQKIFDMFIPGEELLPSFDSTLSPEISAIFKGCHTAKRFLLGSTWLPKPIVEFILEKVKNPYVSLILRLASISSFYVAKT